MALECTNCHITLEKNDLELQYKNKCPMCGKTNTFIDEYIMDIKRISSDESFVSTMIKLHKEDPVEYQLKLNQFKLQQEQSDVIKEQERESNRPHCPTCGSTNIKKITGTERAASVIGLGIFSKKINKSYKCLKCKSTW